MDTVRHIIVLTLLTTTNVGLLRPHKRISKYRVTAFGYVLKPTFFFFYPLLRSAPPITATDYIRQPLPAGYQDSLHFGTASASFPGRSATRSRMSNPQVSILMSRRCSLHRVKNVLSAQPRCHLRFPLLSLGLLIASRHVPRQAQVANQTFTSPLAVTLTIGTLFHRTGCISHFLILSSSLQNRHFTTIQMGRGETSCRLSRILARDRSPT
jgi:hypothetical protein